MQRTLLHAVALARLGDTAALQTLYAGLREPLIASTERRISIILEMGTSVFCIFREGPAPRPLLRCRTRAQQCTSNSRQYASMRFWTFDVFLCNILIFGLLA